MNFNIYSWREKFAREGLTPVLRFELREILTPRVQISAPYKWREEQQVQQTPERIRDLVHWEIVLSGDHVLAVIKELAKEERWREVVHDLLPDATSLIRDVLDLMRELEGADEHHDLSYMAQPSIKPHGQNKNFNDWTALIELARDAWLASASKFPEIAKLEVERWLLIRYPLFKRLAYFAAAETTLFSTDKVLAWLLSDDGWWLWSNETQREAMRLLLELPPRMTASQNEELQKAILHGPPRTLFRDDIEPERIARQSDRDIWLRLSKLSSSGASLSPQALQKLNELTNRHPDWRLQIDDRDEFPVWMGTGDDWTTTQASPKQRRALEDFLKKSAPSDPWLEDDWRSRCLNDFPRAATALLSLALKGHWPPARWREALQAWSTETHARRSWRVLKNILTAAPDGVVKDVSHSLAWWLQTVGRHVDADEASFIKLVAKVLSVNANENYDYDTDLSFRAINHPVGLATEAALRWWYRKKPEDGQRLSPAMSQVFTGLCDTGNEIFRYGRLTLATHSIALFRVDQQWTERHLLPLFDWTANSAEASAAWKGFLFSPRLFRPFISAIKTFLLATALHYDDLHDLGRQYSSLLTFAALELHDIFTSAELASATASLPAAGLAEASHALTQALSGTSSQRAEYWRNRIVPYLNRIWPKNRARLTPLISDHFAQLCTATGDAFPEAVRYMKDWLIPSNSPNNVVHQLDSQQLPAHFPNDALLLLDAVVSDNIAWAPLELRKCLDAISAAQPTLRDDSRFLRLDVLERRRHV